MSKGNGHHAPASLDKRPVLVTGGAGFIGCNLADRLAREGHDVLIYDALARPGVETNLEWLKARHPDRLRAVIADVRDTAQLTQAAAQAKAVFHMAAQVAVTTSLANPIDDFEVNVQGTVRLLDALRTRNPSAPVIFASTNKVYGGLDDLEMRLEGEAYAPVDAEVRRRGVSEARPLDFHTPYGCSKGAADQYVLDWARSFGVPSAVLRMSCIYGPRQMGTEDQGWVAHFLIRALEGRTITLYGDGRQVRDILQVSDAVDAYMRAWARIDRVKGRAFNLGGGPSNAVSLRQLLAHIEELVGRPVDLEFSDWREGDQKYFVADTRKAQAELGLGTPMAWREGVAGLAEWLAEARDLPLRHAQPTTRAAVAAAP
jgi:CDP-paratose 2-epimerase